MQSETGKNVGRSLMKGWKLEAGSLECSSSPNFQLLTQNYDFRNRYYPETTFQKSSINHTSRVVGGSFQICNHAPIVSILKTREQ
jgi:hypothetical protein